jgi:hypothetical protein
MIDPTDPNDREGLSQLIEKLRQEVDSSDLETAMNARAGLVEARKHLKTLIQELRRTRTSREKKKEKALRIEFLKRIRRECKLPSGSFFGWWE